MFLPDVVAFCSGSAADLCLDVIKRADPVQSLAGDLGLGGLPDVVKVAAQMRPACGLPELRGAARPCLIQILESAVGVSLQDPFALLEVLSRVLALVIGREVIGHARWRCPGPRPLITDIGPDPALLHALAKLSRRIRPGAAYDRQAAWPYAGADDSALRPPRGRPRQECSEFRGDIAARGARVSGGGASPELSSFCKFLGKQGKITESFRHLHANRVKFYRNIEN